MSLCHLFSIREEGSALTLLSSFDKIRSLSLCHLFSTREEGSALTLLSSFDKIRSLSLCHYVIMSFVFRKGGRKCLNIIIIF